MNDQPKQQWYGPHKADDDWHNWKPLTQGDVRRGKGEWKHIGNGVWVAPGLQTNILDEGQTFDNTKRDL